VNAPPQVFVFWFGGQPMPRIRQDILHEIRESGLDVILITDDDVSDWVLPHAPLQPAFWLLTPIQRSDYFRAYLMHHYGGAYSDIKRPEGSWLPGLQLLADDPNLWAVGYSAARWQVTTCGIEPLPRYQPWRLRWYRYRWLQLNHNKILGGSGFAFKPGTELTRLWLEGVQERVRIKTAALEANPGRWAKERFGDINDGIASKYPVPWLHIAADVLHPLSYRFRRHIARALPALSYEDYQDPRPAYNSGPRDIARRPHAAIETI